MATFFALNRCLHIVVGFACFFVAPVALAVHKGGVAHRRKGWLMMLDVPFSRYRHQRGRAGAAR